MGTGSNMDARQPANWEIEVARLEERLIQLEKRFIERFDGSEKNVSSALAAAEKAVAAALAAADRAVSKAEIASEKRFEGVNEFRAVLTDQAKTLISRAEVEVLMKSSGERLDTSIRGIIDKLDGPNGLGMRVNELKSTLDIVTSRLQGDKETKSAFSKEHDSSIQQWIAGIALVAVLISLVAIGLSFVRHDSGTNPQVIYEPAQPAVPTIPNGSK